MTGSGWPASRMCAALAARPDIIRAGRRTGDHYTVKGRESGMFKNRGKRGRRWSGWVGPVFAFEALMLALDAKRELEAAQVADSAAFTGPA